MSERDEKNRKLAAWLDLAVDSDGLSVYGDFYRSEEASALLLEKMREMDDSPSDRALMDLFNELRWTRVDRKTAIAEAALLLAERGGQ